VRYAFVLLALAGCWRQAPPEPLHDPPRKRAPADPPWLHAQHRKPKSERTDLSPIAASLSQVDTFALGGVGFTGATGEGENLTLALAREPDALVMFDRLAVDPNRAARLYAYWALRTLDPLLAQRHRGALAHDATPIETMNGCLLFTRTASELATDIDNMPPQRAMPKP
jgi:hypothetical protein